MEHYTTLGINEKNKIHTHTDMEKSLRYNKFFESLEENEG